MSTKEPTGMFPSKQQLQSGDRSLPIKNAAAVKESLHFEGISVATTDPVAGDPSTSGSDKNKAIVEATPKELAEQYAGVYKPGF